LSKSDNEKKFINPSAGNESQSFSRQPKLYV